MMRKEDQVIGSNSLLKDQVYVNLITEIVTSEITASQNLNPSPRWELLKFKIRTFTINYSKRKATERRAHELQLINDISRLEYLYSEGYLFIVLRVK